MPQSAPRSPILVVEDERSIADTVVYALRTEGFDPTWCGTAGEARDWLAKNTPVLVVLDVGLPDANGFDFCRELRAARASFAVIFLTARNDVVDRVVGLEIGGDDYLTKPFSPRELTARVKAVLRRGTNGGNNEVTTNGASAAGGITSTAAAHKPAPASSTGAAWQLDEARCRIAFLGTALELTRMEFRLLRTLLGQPGRVFSRDQLLEAAWDDPGACTDRTVDAHVKLLRNKLRAIAPDQDPIQTHRGLGYSLREDA